MWQYGSRYVGRYYLLDLWRGEKECDRHFQTDYFNTAAITENIFGGSDSGTCGNTEVNVSGGTLRMAYMEVVLLGR